MLTILGALKDEIRLIRAEMEVDKVIHLRPVSILIGKYQHKNIILVQTGVGKQAMQNAVSYCTNTLKPTLLMNIGYAGGLAPQIHNGDIVIANSIIDASSEETWNSDNRLTEETISVLESVELPYHKGRLVTVDKPVTEPHQKAFIGTRFEAIACDMESSAFAKGASAAGIPYLTIRSILDPLDVLLPSIPEEAIIGGEIRLRSLITHFKSHPKDLLKLPKFSYLCSQARIALTNFAKEWVRHERNM